jgi:hypothetical protein
MKMTKFEKFFVNSAHRSQRVAEYAERMLRRVGFEAGQSYSGSTWIIGIMGVSGTSGCGVLLLLALAAVACPRHSF